MQFGLKAALTNLAVTLLAGCNRAGVDVPNSSETSEAPLVSGSLVEVALHPWPTIVRVQGSLLADEVTSVAARVPGRVVSVHFDLGDTVREGDRLVSLDSTEFELKLAQAEAQLAQARAAIGMQPDDELENLNPSNAPPVREARAVLEEARQQVERLQTLFSQGAIVANDLETAQSLASVADARLNSAMNSVREKIALVRVQSALLQLARQELEDTVIVAPFPGLIQNRTIAQGMYVQIGQSLMDVAKTDRLRYRASVPERFSQSLAVGQSVRILVGGQQRIARIERISPTLDSMSRSLAFEAMLENSDNSLKGGLFAPADVVLNEEAQAVVIQPASLLRFAGVDKVWRVNDGQVQEAVVRLGRETLAGVEVVEGLMPGDQILSNALAGKPGRFQKTSTDTEAIAQPEADTPQTDGEPAASRNVSTSPEADSSPPAQAANEPGNPRT